jgi:hypothetical protein
MMLGAGSGKKRARRLLRSKRVAELGIDRKKKRTSLRNRYVWSKVGLWFAFTAITAAVFQPSLFERTSEITYDDGQISREDITAPFDFRELKPPEQLERERIEAARSVPPVLRYRTEVATLQLKQMEEFFAAADSILASDLPDEVKSEKLALLGVSMSPSTVRILADEPKRRAIREEALRHLEALFQAGIVSDKSGLVESGVLAVNVQKPGGEELVGLVDIMDMSDASEELDRRAEETFLGELERLALKELVIPFLLPNVVFDDHETLRRREEAREAVPVYSGVEYKKHQIVVRRGERITDRHVNILRSMNLAGSEMTPATSGMKKYFPFLGRILLGILIISGLLFYMSVRRPLLFQDNGQLTLICILMLISIIPAGVVAYLPTLSEYLIPIAATSMLAAVLFDVGLGTIITVASALIIANFTPFGITNLFAMVIAGAVGIQSVKDARRRGQFYSAGLMVAAAYIVTIVAIDLSKVNLGEQTLASAAWGIVNAFASMTFAMVTLRLFERIFGNTTDLTLLELSDLNNPLLRAMAMKTPGTYHHSIIVGNLAESAADAIGANGLLARVASYYHDLGKMNNPDYFIENIQQPNASKHEALKPRVSSLVLQAHVKDGVELAKQERLPKAITDIIKEHHGTAVMEFFYDKALKDAPQLENGTIDDSTFRYEGPRPRSRESAIVMLADIVEAKSRSMSNNISMKRITNLVEEAVEKRFKAHELDDSELTFRELKIVKDSFIRSLAAMYHQRIRYPGQEEEGEADAGTPGGKQASRAGDAVQDKKTGGDHPQGGEKEVLGSDDSVR